MKNILDHLVYGNILIALCASSLAYFNVQLLDAEVNSSLFLLIFLLTHCTYSLQRLFGNYNEAYISNKPIDKWVKSNFKLSLFTSLISIVGACYLLFSEFNSSIWVLSITSLIAILYVIPFKGKTPLREIAFLKSFLIAFIWAIITSILPYLNSSVKLESGNQIIFLFLTNLFFILGQCIPFDIRDIQYDAESNVKTLPQLIGIKKSKWVSLFFLVLSILFLSLFIRTGENYLNYTFWVMANSFIALLIIGANVKKTDFYYSILLDLGIMIPFILLLFLNLN